MFRLFVKKIVFISLGSEEMDKNELRKNGIERLEALQKESNKKLEKERIIRCLLVASQIWKEAKVIGMYRSLPAEFDTKWLQKRALEEGKIVLIPKSLPGRQLAFYEVDDHTEYKQMAFTIEEPITNKFVPKEEIDLLIVPGLIFSKEGYRIGYGGGFYDRFLEKYGQKTCSLVFSEQLDNDWQPEEFDFPIQKIFTDRLERGADQ